jgi:hypothetical protein
MTEARKLTDLVFKFFSGRAGFDEWWDQLPKQIQKEIKSDLEEVLANTIPESPRPG